MARLGQFRRDTLTNWKATNPILADGEFILIAMDDAKPHEYSKWAAGNGTSTFTQLVLHDYGGEGSPCLQETGYDTQFPMSQKATTDAINIQSYDRAFSGYGHIEYGYLYNHSGGTGSYIKSSAWDACTIKIYNPTGKLEVVGATVSNFIFFDEPCIKSTYLESNTTGIIPAGAKLCVMDLRKSDNPNGYDDFRVRQYASGVDRNELASLSDDLLNEKAEILNTNIDLYNLIIKGDNEEITPVPITGQWFNPNVNSLVINDNYKCYKLDVTNYRKQILHIQTRGSANMYIIAMTDETKVIQKSNHANNEVTLVNQMMYIPENATYLYANCQISYNDAYIKTTLTDKNTNQYDIAPVNLKMREVSSFIGEPFIIRDHFIQLSEGNEELTKGNIYKSTLWDLVILKLFSKKQIIIEGGNCTYYCFYTSSDIKDTNLLEFNSTGEYVEGALYVGLLFEKSKNPNNDLTKLRIIQDSTLIKHDEVLREEIITNVERMNDNPGWINSDGTVSENANFHYSRFRITDVNAKYLISTGVGEQTTLSLVHYYDVDGNYLGNEYPVATPVGGSAIIVDKVLTFPKNTALILVNANNANTPILKISSLGNYYDFKQFKNDIQGLKTNKLMKVHIYGIETEIGANLFYVRTSFNSTKDIILLYHTNSNGLITPRVAYLGDKNLADSTLMTSTYLFSSHSDSTAPLFNSSVYWHLFAQHGYCIPRISNTVNMTSADIGAKWKDQLNREYTIGDVNSTVIYLLPTITGSEGSYTRGWKTPNDTAISSLTHVSGGVVQDTFTTTNLSHTQLYPIVKSYNRKFIIDNEEILVEGDYYCNEFKVSESQIGYDPATVQTWFPKPVLDNALEMARFTWSYNFRGANCCINTTIDIRRKVECQSYGATQQQTFFDTGNYKAMFMIPKAAAKNGVELDKPFNSPNTSATNYEFFRNSTLLKDVNKPIDRLIAFLYNPSTNDYLVGMAAGLSLINGDTTTEKRNANIPISEDTTNRHYRLGSLSPSNVNKFYIAAVNTAPFADDNYNFPNTYFKEINYYVSYFDPAENQGQVYWYKDGDKYVIYAHCQSQQDRLAINLPEFMEGLSLEIVEKTDGTTLLTETIQNAKFYVSYTNDSNYIVLKTN